MTYQGVTVLYDMVRWEEKSLAEASKKIGAEVRMQDCRESRFDLDGDYPEFGTGFTKMCKLLQKRSFDSSA